MRWGYRHERCSKFQRTIQTPVVVITVIHTAAHIYTKSEILVNIRDMPAGGALLGVPPGWRYSQWSGHPGSVAQCGTTPAGLSLHQPQSKRPGKDAE